MKVENVLISSLTPDPKNARKHDKGVPELAVSLTTFGQRKPVVVWGNVVIAGNGLVEAAKSLGWTKIEISRVPVDWTYEQAQAFALADNKTAELSEWDTSTLTEIRFDLDSKGWDTDVFGFELGSGSTLIACEQTGRKCRMMEIDPRYVDVIITRWENLTGKKAKLLK
jgi:site-specific DNA-methyltransferase (adenine-specific)